MIILNAISSEAPQILLNPLNPCFFHFLLTSHPKILSSHARHALEILAEE